MKKIIKKYISKALTIAFNQRILHNQYSLDSAFDVWSQLERSGFRPKTIFDIGAARGEWTQSILALFPESEFLMIDPLIENEASLQFVCEKNKRISYWLGAVGNSSGEIEMNVHSDQSSIFSSEWDGKKRVVPIRQLDSFLEDGSMTSMDALKIDAQGAELSILAGAVKLLKTCKVVQVEVSFRQIYKDAPLFHELVCFFAEKNFRVYDIGEVYKRQEDRALIQADVFFVSDRELFKPETFNI